jgi:hypothetical protein
MNKIRGLIRPLGETLEIVTQPARAMKHARGDYDVQEREVALNDAIHRRESSTSLIYAAVMDDLIAHAQVEGIDRADPNFFDTRLYSARKLYPERTLDFDALTVWVDDMGANAEVFWTAHEAIDAIIADAQDPTAQ